MTALLPAWRDLPADGAGAGDLRRVAMISLHTSPLDQPGTGDAGGMNVYVLELSKCFFKVKV